MLARLATTPTNAKRVLGSATAGALAASAGFSMASPKTRATLPGSLAGAALDNVAGGAADGAAPTNFNTQTPADQAASAHIASVSIRGNHVKAMPDYDSAIAGARRPAFNQGPTMTENLHLRRPAWRRAVARGFTLIELMVVLVIIGVLAALIVPNVLERADDARSMAAKTDVNNLMQALKLYKLDNQRYPSAEQGLVALVVKPASGPIPPNWKPYLDKLPNDPWNNPYQYLNPGIKGDIDVLSFGADGQAGGEGKDADVGSWQ
jgi:general secretion pathway protein G